MQCLDVFAGGSAIADDTHRGRARPRRPRYCTLGDASSVCSAKRRNHRHERRRALRPTYLSNASGSISIAPLPWPEGLARLPFNISHVQDAEVRFGGKFFAVGERIQGARLGGPSESIEIRWRGLDHVGLWMTYGAWPSPNNIVSVAVEPTTSPNDSLTTAIEQGTGPWTLPACGAAAWKVRLSVCDAFQRCRRVGIPNDRSGQCARD
jgi:hypothetical protein